MAATTTASSATTTSASAAATAGVEAYEDMFKEITRKLYGAETGHGLHGTPIAQVATGGHLTLPEGERSFTTLISDRAGNSLEFPNDLNANSSSKSSSSCVDIKSGHYICIRIFQKTISSVWPPSCKMDSPNRRVPS